MTTGEPLSLNNYLLKVDEALATITEAAERYWFLRRCQDQIDDRCMAQRPGDTAFDLLSIQSGLVDRLNAAAPGFRSYIRNLETAPSEIAHV